MTELTESDIRLHMFTVVCVECENTPFENLVKELAVGNLEIYFELTPQGKQMKRRFWRTFQ